MYDFSGKTAIVSGGGRDIGKAISLSLAKSGASVCVNYASSAQAAEATAKEISDAGGKAFACRADLTKSRDADALVAKTIEQFGSPIHILINNTGGLVASKTRPLPTM